jgi:hypothetical protein
MYVCNCRKIIIICNINGVNANIFPNLLKAESIYSEKVLGFNQMIRFIYFLETHLRVNIIYKIINANISPFKHLHTLMFYWK